MGTLGWLVLGIAALACHEFLVARHKPGAGWLTLRGTSLILILISAAVAGPQVLGRLDPLVSGPRRVPATSFVRAGDVAMTTALSQQRPEHPFPAGQSRAAVEEWRSHVIETLRERVGVHIDEPGSVPVEVLQSEMVGNVRRSLVRFTSWDGTAIPAYVFDEEGSQPRGAVLVVPGHGEGIRATSGQVDDYQHAAALELSRHGYVTLTPELRGFGLLGTEGEASHRWVAAAALAAGSSYKAVVVRDLSRALSVLQAWPGVDGERVAVAGTSLGGELAVLLGALDTRVRVVLTHSYAGSTGPETMEEGVGDDARQTPHGCHTIPGVNRILVQEDWVKLVAPRPVLVVRGDRNMPDGASGRFDAAVREAYAAFGAPDRFELAIEPGGHEFYLEPSLRFLSRWL